MDTKRISITTARKNFAGLLNEVALDKEPVILIQKGKEMAALIPIEEFELLHHIEDFIDIEGANKALAEPGKNIPAEKFWNELEL